MNSSTDSKHVGTVTGLDTSLILSIFVAQGIADYTQTVFHLVKVRLHHHRKYIHHKGEQRSVTNKRPSFLNLCNKLIEFSSSTLLSSSIEKLNSGNSLSEEAMQKIYFRQVSWCRYNFLYSSNKDSISAIDNSRADAVKKRW